MNFPRAVLRLALFGLVSVASQPGLRAQTNAAEFGDVVRLGGTPSDVILDESRTRLYLVNTNANRVDVWDYTLQGKAPSIGVGRQPVSAAISMDSRWLYVTNAGTTASPDATLTVIDLNTNVVTATVPLPARPQGVEVGADGRVLICTLGSGTNNANNTLLLYDPSQNSGAQVTAIPVPPPPASPPTITTTLSRPVTTFYGRLLRTPDGQFIVGLNLINNGAATYAFVYEVASATILRSRNVTGQSTVLAMNPLDGSSFMAGFSLYNTANLAVSAQQSTANAPFPFPSGSVNINTLQNLGGSAFSPDGATLYSAFNMAAFTQPPSRPQSSILMICDARNLSIQLGIRMPESLVGKMVISSDGSQAWGASESGLIHLPLGKLYEYPILQPETTQVFLAMDDCNRGMAQAKLRINNLGKGKLTFSLPNVSTALVVQADSGLAPANVTFTMEPGRTGVARQAGTNLSFNFGLGGGAINVDLISPEAINIPNRIRVYMNYRTSDMRGTIVPVPTSPDTNQGLRDIVLDEARGKVYLVNAGFNRLDVYDIKKQRLVDPIPVCQLPQQVAMGTDATTLYVACSSGITGNTGGTEGIGIVDLDTMKYRGELDMPPIPRQGNAALVAPQTLAMGLSGLQFVMNNGLAWKVTNNQMLPREANPVLGIQSNGAQQTIAGPRVMLNSPDYTQIILLNSTGSAYLYDALIDNYTASRQLFSTPIQGMYYGPLGISPQNTYMLANGLILNNSLSAIGGAEKPGQTVTTTTPGQGTSTTIVSAGQRHVIAEAPLDENYFVRLTLPVRQNLNPSTTRDEARSTLELVDVRTSAEQLLGVIPENPVFTLTGTGVIRTPPRWMVVNNARTAAYIISVSGMSVVSLIPSTTATRPTIPLGARGIVNSNDGTANIKPGSFITITGQNLATATTSDTIPLPTVLGGSCVVLSDVALPLLSVSPTQINAQVPDTLRAGQYIFQVRSLGTAQQSDPIVLNVLKN